ncbi:MAG: DUF2163 domain-containing protein [Burkholderiales bacterium]
MKNINSSLANDIQAGTICTAMTVTRVDGVVLNYTDNDMPLTSGGVTYTPAVGLSGIKLVITNNAQVGTSQIRAAWLPVIQESDVIAGIYDNCAIKIGIMSWENPQYGVLEMFSGQLSTITSTQDGFQADVQSALWMLQRPLGIYTTPNCRHQFGSTLDPQGVWGCQVNIANYTVSGTITSMTNLMTWQANVPGANLAATPLTPNAPTLSVEQNVLGQYLPPGTYNYSVSAIVNGNEGPTSPVATVVVQPNNPQQGGSVGGGGIVTISWPAVTGASSYNLYGNTAQALILNTTSLSVQDNGTYAAGGFPALYGDYYAQGIITMTSGNANGMTAVIKTVSNGNIVLLLPLSRPPAVGDTFTMSAGCSKSVATCQYKFNNVINFGGFPDLTPQRNWM